jgi:hypothetical protein
LIFLPREIEVGFFKSSNQNDQQFLTQQKILVMKETDKKSLELIKNEFQTIVFYEKAWMQHANRNEIPSGKILYHFGYENICKIYGCTVCNEAIALELIKEAFK